MSRHRLTAAEVAKKRAAGCEQSDPDRDEVGGDPGEQVGRENGKARAEKEGQEAGPVSYRPSPPGVIGFAVSVLIPAACRSSRVSLPPSVASASVGRY